MELPNLPYKTFTDKNYILERLDKLNFIQPAIPKGYPVLKDKWHIYQNGKWIPVNRIPAGTIVVDVESVNKNRTLALGSAYHLEYQKWFVWFADSNRDSLLPFENGSFIIAHRVCFEMSFIRNTYDSITKVKGICTHSMAALYLHPLKESLLRAMPKIPWFRESSLLDLGGLYKNFTGASMDKSFVEVFIYSNEYQWLGVEYTNTIIRKTLDKIRRKNKKNKIDEIVEDVVLKGLEHLECAFSYNYRDVAATVTIFDHLLRKHRNIDDYTFLGLIEESTPIMYLDDQWYDHIDRIEKTYESTNAELLEKAIILQESHLKSGGDWDGQEWKAWTTKAASNKVGKPKWYDPAKVGITKKETAIAMRLTWLDKPLKRILAINPDKKKDAPKQYWHRLEVGLNQSYEETMANPVSVQLFDNPTNASGKFKNIVNFFSKGFIIFWESGILKSSLAEGQEIVNKQVSTTFWTSIRTRILTLFIKKIDGNLITIPRPSICAAVSGRSVDRVWLVLSKLDYKKMGSEVQGLVKAPKGWKLMNFDLDSCQLRIFAIMCDAYTAKYKCAKRVKLLQTEFSNAAILGDKKNFTSVAHLIAINAGFDPANVETMKKGYTLGKTVQFAALFGASAEKISTISGCVIDISKAMLESYKGIRDRMGKFVGGMGSAGFNAQIDCANGWFPENGHWVKNKYMKSSVLKRDLPNVLSPQVSGKEHMTTKCNTTIQSGDADFKRIILSEVAKEIEEKQIRARYAFSVHDMFAWWFKEEDEIELRDILNRAHYKAYKIFFDTWNVDLDSVPEFMWFPSTIDVTNRWVKDPLDELIGKTVSLPEGYVSLDEKSEQDRIENYLEAEEEPDEEDFEEEMWYSYD